MTTAITRPNNGQTIMVPASQASGIYFEFNPDSANYERDGDNLVFSMPEGQVIIEDFFDGESVNIDTITLPDGIELSALQFLDAIDGQEMLTAYGETTASFASSGIAAYADFAGASFDGLDKFGKQDTIFWESNSEAPEPVALYNLLSTAAPAQIEGPGADEPLNYNTLFLVDISSSATSHLPDARRAALDNLAESILKMCQDFEAADEEGLLNIGVVLFSGTSDGVSVFENLTFDPNAASSLQDVYDSLMNQINSCQIDSSTTTNFQAGFSGALQYVENNIETWSQEGYTNKVFFITDGQPTTSDRSNAGGWVGNDGNGLSTSANKVTSNEVVYEQGENGKEISYFNELQENYNAFTAFLESFKEMTGQEVDVHGLGLIPSGFTHYLGAVFSDKFNAMEQYNSILGFFDNTGGDQVAGDWGMSMYSEGNKVFLENAVSGESTMVRDWDALGKQLYATLTSSEDNNTEYKQYYVDGRESSSNYDDFHDYHDNSVFYISGGTGGEIADVNIGHGDNIIYVGSGVEFTDTGPKIVTGSIDLDVGDGDNLILASWSVKGSITTGDGNNVIDVSKLGGGISITTGEGEDTLYLSYGGGTYDTGDGDDIVHMGQANGAVITLGGGEDTLFIDGFKSANSKDYGGMVFNHSKNTVTDFDFEDDKLDISGLLGDYSKNMESLDDLLDNKLFSYEFKGNDLVLTFQHDDMLAHSSQQGANGWDQLPVTGANAGNATSVLVLQDVAYHFNDVNDYQEVINAIKAATGSDL